MAISSIGTIGVETAKKSFNRYHKVIGLEQLALAKKIRQLPYKVPAGFVQPAGTDLIKDRVTISKAYSRLTADLDKPTGIYARGSTRDEKPGENTSIPSLFLPHDPLGSFERYLAACNQVLQSGRDVAIIGQIMVGKPETVNGLDCIGYSNASFVASYPSPIKRNMVTISSAAGLATKAVEENNKSIVFHSDPEGTIKYILWLEKQVNYELLPEYRQKDMHVYDFNRREIVGLHESIPQHQVFDPNRPVDPSDPCKYALSPFQKQSDIIALNRLISQLAGILGESIEVEGAYLNQELFLWQTRNIPPKPYLNTIFSQLAENTPAIISNNVLGCVNGRKDLITITSKNPCIRCDSDAIRHFFSSQIDLLLDFFQRINKQMLFSDILLPSNIVSPLSLFGAGADVTAVSYYGNPLSHLSGEALQKNAEGRQMMIMHQADITGFTAANADEVIVSDEKAGIQILLFKDVIVESDGDRAQIFLPQR